MSGIRPCPLCDGPAVCIRDGVAWPWAAGCRSGCNLWLEAATREAAIAAWNRRPAATTLPIAMDGRRWRVGPNHRPPTDAAPQPHAAPGAIPGLRTVTIELRSHDEEIAVATALRDAERLTGRGE